MAKNFIVAIELGSTKIRGIAGQKKADGSINVLSVIEEDASQCIRKGVVYNIDKTAQCLSNIMLRLRGQLKSSIRHVFVGIGGQSTRSVTNSIIREQEDNAAVTQQLVMEMMDENRAKEYPDMEILDVEPQEYRADSLLQKEPVGIPCDRIEANFLNILQNQRHYQKLNMCFDNAGIKIAEMYLAPFALADAVLTPAEKRTGCLLVDLGADTTTMMVYYKDVVRHIAVIPLGGNNVTKDLCSLQLEEADAESMKLKYGRAYTPIEEIEPGLTYSVDSTHTVDGMEFINLVEGRMEEIIANVWNQVPAEYSEGNLGNIVLTGGGSNMKDIDVAFRRFTKVQSVRIAETVQAVINSNNPAIADQKDGRYNTLIGLLAKGDQNCCGQEETLQQSDVFASDGSGAPKANQAVLQQPRDVNTLPQGVVQTVREKTLAEEERRAQQQEEERRRMIEEEEERLLQEEMERRQKARQGESLTDKFKKFLSKLTSEE